MDERTIKIVVQGAVGIGKSAIVQLISDSLKSKEINFKFVNGYNPNLDESNDFDLQRVLRFIGQAIEIEIEESVVRHTESVADKNRLVSFLYLLMRDEVPTGIVPSILQKIPESDVEYTNAHLKAMAEDYASRILEI